MSGVAPEGRVLVSTHRLERAGPLREAFQGAGYEVELVTPDEDVSGGLPIELVSLFGRRPRCVGLINGTPAWPAPLIAR